MSRKAKDLSKIPNLMDVQAAVSPRQQKQAGLDAVTDEIQERFGAAALRRSASLPCGKPQR